MLLLQAIDVQGSLWAYLIRLQIVAQLASCGRSLQVVGVPASSSRKILGEPDIIIDSIYL